MRIGRLAVALLAVCAVDASASLQPGALDSTFGFGGQQTVPVDIASAGEVNAMTSIIGPDERIYLVGTALNADKVEAMAIMRLEKDGAIDGSFGDEGVLVHLPQGVSTASTRDATFDSEGRLVVAGQALVGGDASMIACRFGSDGMPDLSFGLPATPGCYSLAVDDGVAHSVLVQHGTGRVILAGTITSNGQSLGMVVGLASNGGGTDSSFGAGFGIQFIASAVLSGFPSEFFHLSQDSAGGLVASGMIGSSLSPQDYYATLVYRLTSEGKLAEGFGFEGVTAVSFTDDQYGYIEQATATALLEDGAVLLAGFSQAAGFSYRPTAVRIMTDGSPDPKFDYEGSYSVEDGGLIYKVCDDPCDMRAHDVAVLPNGNIVMSGTIRQGVEGDTAETLAGRGDFFVMRLLPNGKPDPTFRSPGSKHDGLAIIPFDTYSEPPEDGAYSLVVQGDKLVVAGLARTDNDPDNDVPEFNAAVARIGNGNPLFGDGFE